MTARGSRGSDSTDGRSPLKIFVAALISASGDAAVAGPPCGHPVPSMDKYDDALWFAAQVETSGQPITAAAVMTALGRYDRRAGLDAELAEANTAREAEVLSAVRGLLEALVEEGMLGKATKPLPAAGPGDRPVSPPTEEVRYRITGLGLQKLASMELK